MNKEEIQWKNIDEFGDKYQISDNGDIKMSLTNKLIKNHLDANGYCVAYLCRNEKKYFRRYVHELVALYFIGNDNHKNKMVHHKDGNKLNNNLSNLQYLDFSDDFMYNSKRIIKHIYQYDLDYNFIKEWISIYEILTGNKNYKSEDINNNLHKTSNSSYGFIWSYDNCLKNPENNMQNVVDYKYFLDNDMFNYPEKDKEYWKDIIGFKKYKISNFGNIYNKFTNKILEKQLHGSYYHIILRNDDNFHKNCAIHILVAKHFIPNPNDLKVCHHQNHNKLDNRYTNLAWVTQSDNIKAWHDSKKLPIVLQYDLKGTLIKEWENINEILKIHKKYDRNCITRCLRKERQKTYGYAWKYKDENTSVNVKKVIDNTLKEDEIFRNIGTICENDFSTYEISNYGKIRNIKNNRYLRPAIGANGYLLICLINKKGEQINAKIHRLVAYKFVDGHSETDNCVNHKNEQKLDNCWKNLEWVTPSQNTAYSCGKKIEQIDIETNEIIKIFNSLSEAADTHGKDYRKPIRDVCQGKKKTAHGYKWKYHEKTKEQPTEPNPIPIPDSI